MKRLAKFSVVAGLAAALFVLAAPEPAQAGPPVIVAPSYGYYGVPVAGPTWFTPGVPVAPRFYRPRVVVTRPVIVARPTYRVVVPTVPAVPTVPGPVTTYSYYPY